MFMKHIKTLLFTFHSGIYNGVLFTGVLFCLSQFTHVFVCDAVIFVLLNVSFISLKYVQYDK